MSMNPRLLRPTASGFDPRRIAGLALWLDAQDGTTMFDADTGGSLVAPDGTVGRWVDKSGNSRNATQDVGNNRPTLKAGIVNGRSVLRFNGTSARLNGEVATSNVPFPYSMFIAYQSADNSGVIAGFSRVSGGNFAEAARKSAANTFQGIQQNGVSPDGTANVTAADASWHVGEIVYSGTAASSTFTVRVNGETTGNMTTARARDNTAMDRRLQIGAVGIVGGVFIDFFAGDIAEILVYGRTLSSAELSRIRRYLGRRYRITVTP